MKIAMVGLGKMGANMTQRLIEHGHEVVAFDLNEDARHGAAAFGAQPVATLEELAAALEPPRVAWVMVPAGKPTNDTITTLAGLFESGDVVIDGGNSNYKETAPLVGRAGRRRHRPGRRRHLGRHLGPEGGLLPDGRRHQRGGGGVRAGLPRPGPRGRLRPRRPAREPATSSRWSTTASSTASCRPTPKGFEIMSEAPEFDLDLHEIAAIWRYGSVVRSWLLELAERALRPESGFEQIEGVVVDSGEGRWTVEEAIDRGVSAPVISSALFARFASQKKDAFGLRLVSALRNQFGGHAFTTADGTLGGETGTPK